MPGIQSLLTAALTLVPLEWPTPAKPAASLQPSSTLEARIVLSRPIRVSFPHLTSAGDSQPRSDADHRAAGH
jgi:hypothetical protein